MRAGCPRVGEIPSRGAVSRWLRLVLKDLDRARDHGNGVRGLLVFQQVQGDTEKIAGIKRGVVQHDIPPVGPPGFLQLARGMEGIAHGEGDPLPPTS